jgi:hypothetical protein
MSCFGPIKLNSLLIAFAAVAIEGASAHDMGCDGNPVPEWIKSDCCNEADERLLKPEQISRGPNGEYIVSNEDYRFVRTKRCLAPMRAAISSFRICGWRTMTALRCATQARRRSAVSSRR